MKHRYAGISCRLVTVHIALLLFTVLIFHTAVKAQRQCATPLAIQQALKRDPALALKMERLDSMARVYAENKKWQRNPDSGEIVTIPVVVHIVLQDPSVVSDAQVLSQIAVLNEDYTASNADTSKVPLPWKPLIGNMKLHFCLAQRTPAGLPTNGILRVSTHVDQFYVDDAASAVKHASTGGSDAWDHNRYLNIWLCNLAGNNLGVGTPPGLYPDDEDGVVVQYNAFGTSGNLQRGFDKGRSATHEIGHFFNLLHPWGDGDGTCDPGDGVDDTPPQSGPVYGCVPFPYLSDHCSSSFPGIMFMDFMEYVDDSCMEFFSAGQVTRMQAALFVTRASLLSSDGCVPVNQQDRDAAISSIHSPLGKICDNTVAPVVSLRNDGKDTLRNVRISYQVDGGNAVVYQWTGTLASLDSETVSLPVSQTATGSHILTAFTSQPNGGTDQNPGSDTTTASFHLDTAPGLPFSEGFEGSAYPPYGWTISNPDGSLTWEKTTAASHSGKASVVMRNLAYAVNGRADDLISPVFSIRNTDSAFLSFYVAAAVQSDPDGSNTYWDTLQVLISQDCGQTFTPLYAKWGKTLITDSVPVTGSFIPTATQWRKDSIDLGAYIGKGNFQLVFRNISNFENNIYLDDINLSTHNINPRLKEEKVLVVPNPTTGNLLVEFLEVTPDLLGVSVYSSIGQLIIYKTTAQITNNRLRFNLANEPNGVYFVKILYRNKAITKKIIKLR